MFALKDALSLFSLKFTIRRLEVLPIINSIKFHIFFNRSVMFLVFWQKHIFSLNDHVVDLSDCFEL